MTEGHDRLLLIDNDAFVLLAGSGHLRKVLETLEFTIKQCRGIASLHFVFEKKIKTQLHDVAVQQIEAALNLIEPLEHAPSSSILDQLLAVDEIDIGEAVLLGVLTDQPNALLATNDKRALRALSDSSALTTIRNAINGRILSFESIVKHLIGSDYPFNSIAEGFIRVSPTDTRLRVIFSEHNLAHPEQCLEAIESYLAETTSEFGEDFFYPLS